MTTKRHIQTTVILPAADMARLGLSSPVVGLDVFADRVVATYERDGLETETADEPAEPERQALTVRMAIERPLDYVVGIIEGQHDKEARSDEIRADIDEDAA